MNAHVSPDILAAPCGSKNVASVRVFAAKPVGRPIGADPKSERSRKPWVSEGVSARTFYRRKVAAAANAPESPQQHASHVAAWFATLGAIERLDYRAVMRRSLTVRQQPAASAALQKMYMAALGVS